MVDLRAHGVGIAVAFKHPFVRPANAQ